MMHHPPVERCVRACALPKPLTPPLLLSPQITRGLLQKYGPERVKDTPITEVRVA
jgi:hypothetical protein